MEVIGWVRGVKAVVAVGNIETLCFLLLGLVGLVVRGVLGQWQHLKLLALFYKEDYFPLIVCIPR